jgi:hypothetical protein
MSLDPLSAIRLVGRASWIRSVVRPGCAREIPDIRRSGAWTGKSQSGRLAHPGRIWYLEARLRNGTRDLVSPGLDRAIIETILASGAAGEAAA